MRQPTPLTAAEAARPYLERPASPLEPLARAVERALRQRTAREAVLGRITQALEEAVSARTPEGHALRMALIQKLAGQEAAAATGAAPAQDALLTTAQAAAVLEVSRPYVSMLCDAGKLGEVVLTEGGHRRVRASAVEAYRAAQTKAAQDAPSPRQAGVEAGLYEHEDAHYKNRVRGKDAAAAAPKRRKTRP